MLSCKIHVFAPPNGTFKPLQQVYGSIKYTIYEEMALKKVVISLKGNGVLGAERLAKRKFKESYINIEQVSHENLVLPAGTYKDPFSFELPLHIPPSVETNQDTITHKVSCSIKYYIRIKFDRGYLKSNKTFKKEIIIRPLLIPKLSLEPVKYERFKVLEDSSSFCSYVYISATIENSVVRAGEKIKIYYKLRNGTNYTGFIRVLTSLVEVYKFKPNRPFINARSYTNVNNTVLSSERIQVGNTVYEDIEFEVPRNVYSFEDSSLVLRDYFVKLLIELPRPYNDVVVKIPVQIGEQEPTDDTTGSIFEESAVDASEDAGPLYPGPPPSYWETMGEDISVEGFPVEDEEDAT